MTQEETLFATCTPNSDPVAGHAEHGYQINVLDQDMTILATLDLPDWHTFRPASAGHRLIEIGYMIKAEARGVPKTINGWRAVPDDSCSYMVPVVRNPYLPETAEQPSTAPSDAQAEATVLPSEAELADRIFGPGTAEQLAAGRSVDEQGAAWDEAASGPPRRLADGPGCTPVEVPALTEEQAMQRAREVWPEAEGFLPSTRGWTFRVGGGYASVTAAGVVARDPQGTRFDAVSYMGRRTPPAGG